VAYRGERLTASGGNREVAAKMGVKRASGISRLLGAAKLRSAPDAHNPRNDAGYAVRSAIAATSGRLLVFSLSGSFITGSHGAAVTDDWLTGTLFLRLTRLAT